MVPIKREVSNIATYFFNQHGNIANKYANFRLEPLYRFISMIANILLMIKVLTSLTHECGIYIVISNSYLSI